MKFSLVLLVVFLGVIGYTTSLNALLKSWATCPGKNYPTYLHLFNFKHLGDYVYKVDVNLTGTVDLGANLKYQTNVYKGGRRLPINFGSQDVCKGALAILGDVAVTVLSKMKPKVAAKCPIKKGSYTARNVQIDVKQVKLPIPIKGEFRIELPIQEVATDKEIGCIEILADLK